MRARQSTSQTRPSPASNSRQTRDETKRNSAEQRMQVSAAVEAPIARATQLPDREEGRGCRAHVQDRKYPAAAVGPDPAGFCAA
jgi:hypothetical protein